MYTLIALRHSNYGVYTYCSMKHTAFGWRSMFADCL